MAKFWEFFKKIEESASEDTLREAVQSVQVPAPDSVSKSFLRENGLRQGMWVVTENGVGVVTGVTADCVQVMLTDAAGCNKQQLNFNPGKVTQAKYMQIPEARRQISKLEASKAGYV